MEFFLSLSLAVQILIVYMVIINIVTFFYYGYDKLKSRLGGYRIRERFLYILTFSGGSIGALSAIHFFRHKTKKPSFQAMIILILAIHTTILFFAINK